MPTREEELHHITPETDISAGPFKVNYRVVWIVLFTAASVVVFIAASMNGMPLMGAVFVVLMIVLYASTIGIPFLESGHTTVLAKLYRQGAHRIYKAIGWLRHSSAQPTAGEVFGMPPGERRKPPQIKILGNIRILPYIRPDPEAENTAEGSKEEVAEEEGVSPPPPLGIVHDKRYGTYSATLWTAGSPLSTADIGIQHHMLDGFAHLLNLLAQPDNLIERFVWREQTLMGEPQDANALMETIQSGAGRHPSEAPNEEVFRRRTEVMGRNSVVHRTTMTLTVNARSGLFKRQAKLMGGPHEVLIQELDAFYTAASGPEGVSPIGMLSGSFLDYNSLVREFRLITDPVFGQPLWEGEFGPDDPLDLLDEHTAWPGYANFEESEDYCRLGKTYHMGFYIAELTRTGVRPEQFEAIRMVRVPKTVTAVFQMVPPRVAQRRAQWATVGARSTNADRAAKNRLVTEVNQAVAEAATQHEKELARNKGQDGRVRLYVDVTGRTVDEVRANAQQVIKAAGGARFVLEALTGRQELGIEAALPAGRGLAAIPPPQWL